MKNLKKLKNVLAMELEAREVYKEAFDIVKDAEHLEKYIKDLSAEVKSVENDVLRYRERAEKAKRDALKLEEDYSARSREMSDLLDDQVKTAARQSEAALVEARDKKEALQVEAEGIKRVIKSLRRKELDQRSKTEAAERELEAIRGKLKSI